MEEALKIRKVAEILGVSVKTVRNWIHKGHIRAYRVGPQLIMIPRTEVVRMRSYRASHVSSDGGPIRYESV